MIKMETVVPALGRVGTWIGRCFVPGHLAHKAVAGPHVVWVKDAQVFDLSHYYDSTSQLINSNSWQAILNLESNGDYIKKIGDLEAILANSLYQDQDHSKPYFLAPNDAQSVKACGVTFIKSLLERVIEEKAKGNALLAAEIREQIIKRIGTSLGNITPGSEKALLLKEELQRQGVWSQYLEVGIGKDAEVFTKSQPFASVGFGTEIGILEDSSWNNPEPEIVLAVSNAGKIVGATLGNDVNLRDYEGRSALLLGEAKDQNGSCAIGPLFRLFDESFGLDDVKAATVGLAIQGKDGFSLEDESKMSEISRSPEALVAQVIGKNHQYPDGFVLFCGTMFAPTLDRNEKDLGFTHKIGDKVSISSPLLGTLTNWVNTCDQIPRWEFGIHQFVAYVLKRR